VQLERLGKLKMLNVLIGPRTRDLPPCIISPQPFRLCTGDRDLAHDMKNNTVKASALFFCFGDLKIFRDTK
jgi:hypothetical protein